MNDDHYCSSILTNAGEYAQISVKILNKEFLLKLVVKVLYAVQQTQQR